MACMTVGLAGGILGIGTSDLRHEFDRGSVIRYRLSPPQRPSGPRAAREILSLSTADGEAALFVRLNPGLGGLTLDGHPRRTDGTP